MSQPNRSSGNGISLLGVLGVVFVVLKLVGVIDWSWWLVTLPFWGGIAALLVGICVYLFIAAIWEALR